MKKVNLVDVQLSEKSLLTRNEKKEVLGGKMMCLVGPKPCPDGMTCIRKTCEYVFLPIDPFI